jgi:hypothetical protein
LSFPFYAVPVAAASKPAAAGSHPASGAGAKVVCDEHGIGSEGEHCGYNYAQLDRVDVFYHEVSGGKYVPRAVLMGLGPVVIGDVALICRSASSSTPKYS